MSTPTLTPAETLGLVNDGFTTPDLVESGGLAVLAQAVVEGAVGDLRVLSHAANVEAIDGDDLAMSLIRVLERLEAASSMLHRHIFPRVDEQAEQANGAEPADCPLADCPMRPVDHEAARDES